MAILKYEGTGGSQGKGGPDTGEIGQDRDEEEIERIMAIPDRDALKTYIDDLIEEGRSDTAEKINNDLTRYDIDVANARLHIARKRLNSWQSDEGKDQQ